MYSSVNGECQPDSPKLCPSGPRRGEHALWLPAPGGLLSLAPGLLSLNGGTKRGLGLKPVWPMHHPQLPPPGSSDALGAVRNPSQMHSWPPASGAQALCCPSGTFCVPAMSLPPQPGSVLPTSGLTQGAKTPFFKGFYWHVCISWEENQGL